MPTRNTIPPPARGQRLANLPDEPYTGRDLTAGRHLGRAWRGSAFGGRWADQPAHRPPGWVRLWGGEPDGVAEVGVSFQERDAGHLVRMRPGVLEHVQAVADIDGVDQPVA